VATRATSTPFLLAAIENAASVHEHRGKEINDFDVGECTELVTIPDVFLGRGVGLFALEEREVERPICNEKA
jgi:hypothetical protein